MKSLIWIPLYIGDYLGDTLGLTLAQHGGYLLIIFSYWKNGGPLAEPDARAVIRDASATDARRIASFFQIKDGFWHHKRIDEELARASRNRSSRSNACSTAAKARWNQERAKKDPMRDASVTQCVTHESRIRDAVPSPSPSVPNPPTPQGDGNGELHLDAWAPTPLQRRFNRMVGRRDTTAWDVKKEIRRLKTLEPIPEDDLLAVEKYYGAKIPEGKDYRRRDLCTLLNNWAGEVDRARRFRPTSCL
jgi:uncharacterized protein YdaU (DUF1376 family)